MTPTPSAPTAEMLAQDAQDLVKRLSNASFNAGYEDAGDAWTRQEKACALQTSLLNDTLAAIDRLAALARSEPPTGELAAISDREYLRIFEEGRHGSDRPSGTLRGIRAVIAAYEGAAPPIEAQAGEPKP